MICSARTAYSALAILTMGCTSLDGGAIEADWVVSSEPDGRVLRECACPLGGGIDRLSFRLVGRGEREGTTRSFSFACRLAMGASPFTIPPGEYEISLTPLDGAGRDLSASPARAFPMPGAFVRRIEDGQVTSLGVWPVTLDCRSPASPPAG